MSETKQANPSSGRWKYGREIAENFAESSDYHVTNVNVNVNINLRVAS